MPEAPRKPLLFLAAFAVSGIAAAAGMDAASAPEWNGFHVGVDAIYGQGRSTLTSSVSNGGSSTYFEGDSAYINEYNAFGKEHGDAGDVAGGLEGGYDWQFSDFLVGLQAEVTDLDLNESAGGYTFVEGDAATEYQTLHTSWGLTLGPRIGLALGDFLLEVNAGADLLHATYTEQYHDIWEAETEAVSSDKYLIAPVFGAGVHYHVSQNWVAKADFSIAEFGTTNVGSSGLSYEQSTPPTTSGQGSLAHSFNLTTETLSLGMDYQF